MRITPKTEAEVQEAGLLTAGEHPFEVLEAAEKQSKAGNDMLAMKLGIDTEDGKRAVFDYLGEFAEYKLRHFFDTIGQLEMYESGNIDAEALVGCTGVARIVIQPAKDGYDAKNSVKDYVKRDARPKQMAPKSATKKAAKSVAAKDMPDDDIPF